MAGKNPLETFILECDLVHCENCRLSGDCCQKRVIELAEIISAKALEIDPDACLREMHPLLHKQ